MTPDPAARAREIVEKALHPYGTPNALTHRERLLEAAIAAALTEPFASEAKRDPADPREARLREALRASTDLLIHALGWSHVPLDRARAGDQVLANHAALASPPPDETGVADAGASGRSTARGADEETGGPR